MAFKICQIYTGKAAVLSNGQTSAILPTETHQSLFLGKNDIEGNEVVDLKHHGGPDRVLHQVSLENYELLKKKFPEAQDKFVPGSLGENISTLGATEKTLRVGDVFSLGTAKIELTEPRIPCSTIDAGYELKGVLKFIVQQRISGCFYRILEEGEFSLGDTAVLVEQGPKEFVLDRVLALGLKQEKDETLRHALIKSPALSTRWRDYLSSFKG